MNSVSFLISADSAPMAYVQKEYPGLAASYTRELCWAKPKAPGKPKEKEAQITHLFDCLYIFFISN